VVAHRRSGALSRGNPIADHRRWRGPQWLTVRLWKRELQKLANELALDIAVSHLRPAPASGNKIEHRLFSFISPNWRAKLLVSYRVIIEPISATTTKTGAANSTPANTPAALSYRMQRWPPSTSNAPSSMVSGTTPSLICHGTGAVDGIDATL
jgi:hypothetical protein